VEGRLLVENIEFNQMWLLDGKKRIQEIEQRLFGQTDKKRIQEIEQRLFGQADVNHEVKKEDTFLEAVVREAIHDSVGGPVWVQRSPGEGCVFIAGRGGNDRKTVFQITDDLRRELRALVPVPLRSFEMTGVTVWASWNYDQSA
jgi:hypothetical protein